MVNSTQPEPHPEVFGAEWREFALNGEKGRRMERNCIAVYFLLEGNSVGTTGDIVQDALDEDDADVDVGCDVGEELVEQIVGGVGGVPSDDTNDGGRGVTGDAGHVQIRKLRADGVGEECGVVGHGGSVVVPADEGARDGVDDAR